MLITAFYVKQMERVFFALASCELNELVKVRCTFAYV